MGVRNPPVGVRRSAVPVPGHSHELPPKIGVNQSLTAAEQTVLVFSRRFFVGSCFAALSSGAIASEALAPGALASGASGRAAPGGPEGAENDKIAPRLLQRALEALERHHD